MTRRELDAVLGPAAFDAPVPGRETVVVDLGTAHPSAHGGLRVALTADGDGPEATIVSAEPHVGYLHRGAEKLFEVRDYRQALALANRHDWLSAFANEIGLCLAVEAMLGMEIPERATWLRTLLAELNRALSHLAFLAGLPAAGPEVAATAWQAREALLTVLEELTGGRMHVMVARVGGLKVDVPLGWPQRLTAAVATARAGLPTLTSALDSDPVVAATAGLGVLSAAEALAVGASGVVARASGVDLDLRRDDPVLAYAELGFGTSDDFPVVGATAGDAQARFRCLLAQTVVALDLVEACLDRLLACPPGPVGTRLPKTLTAPEGVAYGWSENPLGIMGYLLVSRGEKTPWRLHLRTPSFAHVQVLRAVLPGTTVGQLPGVLASLFFVVGDIDR